MRTVRDLVIVVAVLAIALVPMMGDAQGIMGYRPVTDQRLAEPEAANWLMTRGNYQGWSYSSLDQINIQNVRKLAPAWAFSTGVDSGHQAPLLVNNGIMFVTTPYNQVIAMEAKTGKLLWRYKREMPEGLSLLHNTSRGVALYADKVYLAAHDCALVALDATTGNAAPWFGDQRPGDNLVTSSTIALNPDTGKLVAHFQYHWNDSWDWDEPDAPIILDYTKDGRDIKGLVKPARNGYLYRLERSSDKISFVSATPYVKQKVFKSIDPTTGRPGYHPDRVPGTGKRADFCPSLWGGKDWPFAAYNPRSGTLHIPANDNHCGYMEGKIQPYVAGKWWTGVDIPDIGFAVDKSARHFGEVQAWDVNGNRRVWSHLFTDSMNWGPVLTTAGGLVFGGGTNDRYFRAFDASTGEVLWQFRTNSGITAPPVSFAVDGVQYIGVASGWGVDPAFQQGLLGDLLGWQKDVPQGGVVWVFAVAQ